MNKITKNGNKTISNKNFKDIIDEVMENDLSIDEILKNNNIQNVVNITDMLTGNGEHEAQLLFHIPKQYRVEKIGGKICIIL